MHVIPPYEPGVLLCHRDGARVRYASLKDACAKLGYWWTQNNLGADFHSPWLCPRLGIWTKASWVMVTDFGAAVSPADFAPFHTPRPSYWFRRFGDYCGYGPVPGVHRHRGGRMFRRMANMNERRAAHLVLSEEGEVAPRAKRSFRLLPNPWDDYIIAARENRSWKRHRKTRWKA